MANTVDYHAKQIIGDMVLTIAKQTAEIEMLREELGRLRPQDESKPNGNGSSDGNGTIIVPTDSKVS